ncbi:MAG: tyrosinase family protein [Deltaproteobacteria bacterium]|nr:tyrosinase family protein [Nannocystaceae bacterium]
MSGWTIEDAIEHGIVDRERVDEARETLDRLAEWIQGDGTAGEVQPTMTRVNIHDVSDADAMALQQALLECNRADNPVWGRFVFLHAAALPLLQGHPELRYLPWHRLFLATFESALRATSPTATLPYWTWWHPAPGRAELPLVWQGFAPTIVMPDVRRDRGLARLIVALSRHDVVEAAAVLDPAMTVTTWRSRLAAMSTGGEIAVHRTTPAIDPRIGGDAIARAMALNTVGPDGLSGALEQMVEILAAAHGGAMAEPAARMADPLSLFVHAEIDRLWSHWQGTHVEPHPLPAGAAVPPWPSSIDDVVGMRAPCADLPIDDPPTTGRGVEDADEAPWAPEQVLGEDLDGAEAVTLVYKIHPAIGIARVGDSTDEWFVGPETPGRFVRPVAGMFRDRNHKIKRQAARFRVWEYEQSASGKLTPKREITTSAAAIKWTVHVANKKAAFFEFHYQRGQRTAPGGPLSGFASSHPLRNPSIGPAGGPWDHADRRAKLWIAPGPVSLDAAEGAQTIVETSSTVVPITRLGALRTDRLGRLYVYGGHGRAKPKVVGSPLTDTFNNVGWFDDVCDGPVSAELTFTDGRRVKVGGWTSGVREGDSVGTDGGGAWVIVAPPDYAPQITNVMTLYDVLLDVARRHLTVPNNSLFDPPSSGTGSPGQLWRLTRLKAGLGSYTPSFTHEVYPLLVRVLDQRWVDRVLQAMIGSGGFHGPTNVATMWADLGTKASTRRGPIFARIRPPTGTPSSAQSMPMLWGDGYNVGEGLRLTETQYRILERWKDGFFVEDWPGSPPAEPAENVTPDGLDRAALESAVGGAMAVGIEASWLIRDPENFAEPLRIKHHASRPPGHFSAQMALPWHTDFLACVRTRSFGWWPAIRPDEVFVRGNTTMQPWARDGSGGGLGALAFTNAAWNEMGFVIDINGDRSRFEERERK